MGYLIYYFMCTYVNSFYCFQATTKEKNKIKARFISLFIFIIFFRPLFSHVINYTYIYLTQPIYK